MTTQTLLPDVNWGKVGLWGPPRPRRDWGPRDVAYALCWLVGANIALAVPVVAWMVMAGPGTDVTMLSTHPAVLSAGLLTLWAVFIGVPAHVTRHYGVGSMAADFGWGVVTRADWRLGLGVGLVMRAVDTGASSVATWLGWTTGDNSSWLFAPRAWVVTAAFAVGAAVVAPALEELFFRGFILRALAKSRHLTGWTATVFPIAVSSVIFGVLHTTAFDASGLYVMCSTAVAGAVLAVIATRRGNLGAAIAAHIVFNTTGVIEAWVMTR